MEPSPDRDRKSELRRRLRERLRKADAAELARGGACILQRLQWRLPRPQASGLLAMFGGLTGEPPLLPESLPGWRGQGWRPVVFAVHGSALIPREVFGSEDLVRGPFGVWEPRPQAGREAAVADLEVILVPGLGFDPANGGRLGRGGGFYDRLLDRPGLGARRIGVAYECQLVAGLPREPHDLAVHELVTECAWRCWERP